MTFILYLVMSVIWFLITSTFKTFKNAFCSRNMPLWTFLMLISAFNFLVLWIFYLNFNHFDILPFDQRAFDFLVFALFNFDVLPRSPSPSGGGKSRAPLRPDQYSNIWYQTWVWLRVESWVDSESFFLKSWVYLNPCLGIRLSHELILSQFPGTPLELWVDLNQYLRVRLSRESILS